MLTYCTSKKGVKAEKGEDVNGSVGITAVKRDAFNIIPFYCVSLQFDIKFLFFAEFMSCCVRLEMVRLLVVQTLRNASKW